MIVTFPFEIIGVNVIPFVNGVSPAIIERETTSHFDFSFTGSGIESIEICAVAQKTLNNAPKIKMLIIQKIGMRVIKFPFFFHGVCF